MYIASCKFTHSIQLLHISVLRNNIVVFHALQIHVVGSNKKVTYKNNMADDMVEIVQW